MPRGDRSGPMGAGARSGRMAGYCAGFDTPGYANAAPPAGAGMGMGRRNRGWGGPVAGGRGLRQRYFAGYRPERMYFGNPSTTAPTVDLQMDIDDLKNRSQALRSELDVINQRLEALDAKNQG